MKSKEQIRSETGPIPRPANYKYGEKLKEWDDSLPPGAEDLLARIESLLDDRIIVQLLKEGQQSDIVLTDARPLIGGMRLALVLKCGPGKWMPKGWRRPLTVQPGDLVYIGNWVDLEANGLALCQEGDIRLWQS